MTKKLVALTLAIAFFITVVVAFAFFTRFSNKLEERIEIQNATRPVAEQLVSQEYLIRTP